MLRLAPARAASGIERMPSSRRLPRATVGRHRVAARWPPTREQPPSSGRRDGLAGAGRRPLRRGRPRRSRCSLRRFGRACSFNQRHRTSRKANSIRSAASCAGGEIQALLLVHTEPVVGIRHEVDDLEVERVRTQGLEAHAIESQRQWLLRRRIAESMPIGSCRDIVRSGTLSLTARSSHIARATALTGVCVALSRAKHKDPSGEHFVCADAFQDDPSPPRTTQTVRRRILASSASDHCVT